MQNSVGYHRADTARLWFFFTGFVLQVSLTQTCSPPLFNRPRITCERRQHTAFKIHFISLRFMNTNRRLTFR